LDKKKVGFWYTRATVAAAAVELAADLKTVHG
jgi:hypothetical protein